MIDSSHKSSYANTIDNCYVSMLCLPVTADTFFFNPFILPPGEQRLSAIDIQEVIPMGGSAVEGCKRWLLPREEV